ncbi:hypothetical protein [Chryseobacterium indoltheticum]|uniref:hypothetical protein n=1 Tax=Chryseobacterium indoltheticum TaxID=254 RepID=UPI003F490A1A
MSQSQYYAPNQAVKNIIDENLHTRYEALPEEFKDYASMVFYKEKILFNSIITFLTESNTDKNTSAILKLVLSQDEISQQNYF